MPVAFEELEGSPRLHISEQATTAQRLFRVSWSDWPAFARELVGSYQVIGGTFTFVAPRPFPDMPNLLVSELEVEPFDPSAPDGQDVGTLVSGVNRYPAGGALVTATYRTAFDSDNRPREQTPTVPAGTYVTYQADVATEYFTTPGRVWRWDDAPDNPPLAEDINPGVIRPQGAFQLVWRRVAAPPWDTIRALRGKVNQAAFLGAPEGCVLFLGAEASREFHFLPEGGFWRVAYRFQENTKQLSDGSQVGWNYFYKETAVDDEHWVAIQDDSGNTPYLAGDFTELFAFG